MEKQFTLFIIKKDDKYLMKCDPDWDMVLLPHYNNTEFTLESALSDIANKLEVNPDDVKCEFYAKDVTTKISKEDSKEKTYNHQFYEVLIPDNFKTPEGYKWMTFFELYSDDNTAEYNSDVLNILKLYEDR